MGINERTILRIRCNRKLFRHFKKIAADYDSYEVALEMIIEAYERHVKNFPSYPMLKQKEGAKYIVTG